MEKKKVVILVGAVLAIVVVFIISIVVIRSVKSQRTQQSDTEQITEVMTGSESTAESAGMDELQTELGTESETMSTAAVMFEIDSLLSFLNSNQLEEVKSQVLEWLPEQENDKLCIINTMTYQEVSAEEMTVKFFLCDSDDIVYEGHYNFKTLALSIVKSEKLKADIEELERKEQERILESERAAQEEATKKLESERAAESERLAESERIAESEKAEKEKKQKETETEKEADALKTTVD